MDIIENEVAFDEIMESKAYGFSFWNQDRNDCLDECEFWFFW